jgi:adenylate cyclase
MSAFKGGSQQFWLPMWSVSGEHSLKNIARPVRVERDGEGTTPAPPADLPDQPSIAVLPFQNMSGDPEQDYFCDGLVEDIIITTLSKLAGLRVIARDARECGDRARRSWIAC